MSVAQNVAGYANMTVNIGQTDVVITSQTINGIVSQSLQYVNATGQSLGVDQLYAATITLAASTPQTFHFQTATLKDIFGNTLAMLRIRELVIVNSNTTLGQDLKVESAATNGITWLPPSTSPLYARSGTATSTNGFGGLRIFDPASFGAGVGNVISSTTDGLTLDPGTNTITVQILVLGCSVA